MYPKYANGYDSLAEAYMENGEMKKAIKFYAKSLELDLNNTNAIEKLNEIKNKSK
jgi:predicted Zn-dependent protease